MEKVIPKLKVKKFQMPRLEGGLAVWVDGIAHSHPRLPCYSNNDQPILKKQGTAYPLAALPELSIRSIYFSLT
jgi:hypothetical protein